VPGLTGLPFSDAIARLNRLNAGFTFNMREPAEGETRGVVFAQDPAAGTEMNSSEKVTVGIIAPLAAAGEGAGLFRYLLPVNPYPLPLTVHAELPNGTRQNLVSTNHSGGEFSMPYKLPSGSVIVLSMVDREIYRHIVAGASADGS
jgi:hypothetical protein